MFLFSEVPDYVPAPIKPFYLTDEEAEFIVGSYHLTPIHEAYLEIPEHHLKNFVVLYADDTSSLSIQHITYIDSNDEKVTNFWIMTPTTTK